MDDAEFISANARAFAEIVKGMNAFDKRVDALERLCKVNHDLLRRVLEALEGDDDTS